MHNVSALIVAEGVVVGVLDLRAHGVTGREVENDYIAFLGCFPSGETFVFPVRVIEVTLATTEPLREGVLHEGH